MGLTELIQILGDDNITFQNLANSCSGGTTNRKGEVTYKLITEPKNDIASVLMNRSITCFVLWLDTAKVQAAFAQGSQPKPQDSRIAELTQHLEAVIAMFTPGDREGNRTLLAAQAAIDRGTN